MSLYSELHLGVLRASLSQLSTKTFLMDEHNHSRRLQYSSSIWIECYYLYLLLITQNTQMIREVRLVATNKQHHGEYYPLRNEKLVKNVSNMFLKYSHIIHPLVTLSNSPFSGN